MENAIHVFVGNYKTGEVLNRTVDTAVSDVEETTMEMLKDVGWDSGIWATYDGRNSLDKCAEDFAAYMDYRAKN